MTSSSLLPRPGVGYACAAATCVAGYVFTSRARFLSGPGRRPCPPHVGLCPRGQHARLGSVRQSPRRSAASATVIRMAGCRDDR